MWSTSNGDRVLTGAEGELFHYLAREFSDLVIEACVSGEEHFCTSAAPFNDLTPEQQVSVLSVVIPALLDSSILACTSNLTAASEAAIHAIYLHAMAEVEHDAATLLPLVRRALKFCGSPEEPPTKGDEQGLRDAMEALMDQVLHDRDFLMGEYQDLSPSTGDHVRKLMDIDEDYFGAVPADPRDVGPLVTTIQRYTHADYSSLAIAKMPLSFGLDES